MNAGPTPYNWVPPFRILKPRGRLWGTSLFSPISPVRPWHTRGEVSLITEKQLCDSKGRTLGLCSLEGRRRLQGYRPGSILTVKQTSMSVQVFPSPVYFGKQLQTACSGAEVNVIYQQVSALGLRLEFDCGMEA